MSTQTTPNTLNIQGIVVGVLHKNLNMFKTFGNVIMIKWEDFQQICSNTSAAINKILGGECTLNIINSHTDKTALFHLCSSADIVIGRRYYLSKVPHLDNKQIKYALKSVEDIEGKVYYLVITS